MGADHSMHLDRCSRGFQQEYKHIMLKLHKAQRDAQGISDPQARQEVANLFRSVNNTLRECWMMSRERYPDFENNVRCIEGEILSDIEAAEALAQRARMAKRGSTGMRIGGMGGRGAGGGGYHYPSGSISARGPRPVEDFGSFGRPGGGFGQPLAERARYRDQRLEQDSFDYDRRHHHAATVHGVMHCKGRVPLQKGARYRLDFGEMRGQVGVLRDIQGGRNEARILLVGRGRYGEWEEVFDEFRNEYGQIVFPIHRV